MTVPVTLTDAIEIDVLRTENVELKRQLASERARGDSKEPQSAPAHHHCGCPVGGPMLKDCADSIHNVLANAKPEPNMQGVSAEAERAPGFTDSERLDWLSQNNLICILKPGVKVTG